MPHDDHVILHRCQVEALIRLLRGLAEARAHVEKYAPWPMVLERMAPLRVAAVDGVAIADDLQALLDD